MHRPELGMHVATCPTRTAGGWLFKPCLVNGFWGYKKLCVCVCVWLHPTNLNTAQVGSPAARSQLTASVQTIAKPRNSGVCRGRQPFCPPARRGLSLIRILMVFHPSPRVPWADGVPRCLLESASPTPNLAPSLCKRVRKKGLEK